MLPKLSVLILTLFSSILIYTWYRLHVKISFHAPNSVEPLPDGWNAETKHITTSDGLKIAYWYFPAAAHRSTVILIHGYNTRGGKPQMLKHAAYLNREGYSTVLLDLRAYGESDGTKMSLGVHEWKDVAAVVDHFKKLPENQDKKVGIFGVSMGGATAINTAGLSDAPDFIISAVPYADFESVFRFQIKKANLPDWLMYPFMRLAGVVELGHEYEAYTPRKLVQNIKVPIFIISAKIHTSDSESSYRN